MSATENRAAWIHEKGGQLTIRPSEVVQPGPGEVLLKSDAWGINPMDWKIQGFGMMLEKYPAILGFDIAGEVGKAVWEDFLPGALERGKVRALVKTAIAGQGLESIQAGIDTVKAGVLGTKVVVVA